MVSNGIPIILVCDEYGHLPWKITHEMIANELMNKRAGIYAAYYNICIDKKRDIHKPLKFFM